MTGGDLEDQSAGWRRRSSSVARSGLEGHFDGGHGVLVYHYGKQTARSSCGRARLTRWMPTCCSPGTRHRRRQGTLHRQALQLDQCQRRVVPLRSDAVAAPRLVQADDQARRLQGLKFPSASRMTPSCRSSALVARAPGGEIVAAMDRGLMIRGIQQRFADKAWLPGRFEGLRCELPRTPRRFEIMFNKDKEMLQGHQAIIAGTTGRFCRISSWKAIVTSSRTTSKCEPRTSEVLQDAGCDLETA